MHSRPLGMNTRGSLKNKKNLYGQLMIDVWFESIKALLWLADLSLLNDVLSCCKS